MCIVFKLMNDMLSSYFEHMKHIQLLACNYYVIPKPRLRHPIINYEFGKQIIQNCLIKGLMKIIMKLLKTRTTVLHPFFTCKITLKINIINCY